MEIKLDIAAEFFDDDFTASAFTARVREFAVIELIRVKRLHEHEAARMLALDRWELVEKMEQAGIVPTEREFDKIKGELGDAIESMKSRNRRLDAPKEKVMNRLLHTMIRVNDLNESLKFYCDALGMKLLRKHDYPNGEFTLAFVGYEDEDAHTVIELTHNWGTKSYEQGSAFGHLAVGVDDLYATCATLKEKGVRVVREPGPMKFGGPHIAFIEDPTGYKVELIQTNTVHS